MRRCRHRWGVWVGCVCAAEAGRTGEASGEVNEVGARGSTLQLVALRLEGTVARLQRLDGALQVAHVPAPGLQLGDLRGLRLHLGERAGWERGRFGREHEGQYGGRRNAGERDEVRE